MVDVYGEKLGKEAYVALNRAPVGTSFRKNIGVIVQVVDNQKVACNKGDMEYE